MDRRSWPWKRRSSEKSSCESDFNTACLNNKGIKQGKQEQTKPVSFLQISLEKYEYFIVLEEQEKVLIVELKEMKEKLTAAQAEMATKDDLVKQHAKVAEEAIAGWEKAEAETSDLKQKLESVTLLKSTAEKQAAHHDSELKECIKQACIEKEENEKKLHDVIFAETKLWEKVKSEFEATIADFEQELLKSSAEIDALSRSLQERSVLLMKISEEKAQADAEIEILKTNLQSYEEEATSLKYELNIVAKELQIRNEETNMSVKSAEVANKQHVEAVKKVNKLEAECQRLRSLVKKRLPGPASLAQMKLEVESLGLGVGESRLRRLSGKSSSHYPFLAPEIDVNEAERYKKDNEFLTARLLAMEEELKLLKEVMSKDTECQASSSRRAKTPNKPCIVEAHMLSFKSNAYSVKRCSSQNESSHGLASMPEDGVFTEERCSQSGASALNSKLSQLEKEHSDKRKKNRGLNQLELIDDFLEMERLAGYSDEGAEEKKNELSYDISSVDVHMDVCKEQTSSLKKHAKMELVAKNQLSWKLLWRIQALISSLSEFKLLDSKLGELVDEIMKTFQVEQNGRPLQCRDPLNAEAHCSTEVANYETVLMPHGTLYTEIERSMNKHLKSAIFWIHEFVVLIHTELTRGKSSELQATGGKVEEFSDSGNNFHYTNLNLGSFILYLNLLFSKTKEVRLTTCVTDNNSSSDCIDKVTLLENGVVLDSTEGKIPRNHDLLSASVSVFDVAKEPGNSPSETEDATSNSFSLRFFEKLKMERDGMEVNLINCREALENTKRQMAEIELNLAELKQQFSASKKSNDLADTQLRCMTESYKLLESHAANLEAEIKLLRSKAKALESELIANRRCHNDDLAKFNDQQEQIRSMSYSQPSCRSEADVVIKARQQDRDIAATTDKIATCQETIFLLKKQLKCMHPHVEPPSKNSCFREESSLVTYNSQQSHYPAMESDHVSSSVNQDDSTLPEYSSQFSTAEMESCPTSKLTICAKRSKHRSRSTSDSSLAGMLNDKAGRGFSRFFSQGKGKP